VLLRIAFGALVGILLALSIPAAYAQFQFMDRTFALYDLPPDVPVLSGATKPAEPRSCDLATFGECTP